MYVDVDGFRGVLIISPAPDSVSPHFTATQDAANVDQVVSLTDWYHDTKQVQSF